MDGQTKHVMATEKEPFTTQTLVMLAVATALSYAVLIVVLYR